MKYNPKNAAGHELTLIFTNKTNCYNKTGVHLKEYTPIT